MIFDERVLTDPEKDNLLKKNHSRVYMKTQKDRFIRLCTSRTAYFNQYFPNGYVYSEQELRELLEKPEILTPEQIAKFQKKLDSGDFARPGTPEWDYKDQYRLAYANFLWPDANEQQIRATEEAELEKLL